MVHAPQTPATHAWPFAQSEGDWHFPHCRKGSRHPCPGMHSVDDVQEHEPLLHVAVGPHWAFVAHEPQTPDVQT